MTDSEETTFAPSLGDMPLLSMSDTGAVPKSRLCKSSAQRSIYMKMQSDDRLNSLNRAKTQDLLDGGTPYSEAELMEANQPDTTNLNFGGAEEQLEKAMAPYYDLVQSPEDIVSVCTLHGFEENRDDWNAILSEEISRTIRDGEQFTFQTSRLAMKHVWDGVGVGYWPDELDWRYLGSGLGQFYFPRQSFACESELPVVCAVQELTVTQLYKKISVDSTKWNKEAVENAIRKATSALPAFQDWEYLMEEIKNNDLGVDSRTPLIRVIHSWVQEFNGKISHFITTEEDQGTEDFLYCCHNKYSAMRQALVMFPYGLGTNTKTHGIRGLGYKIYAFEQQRNRSLSRLIDQGNLASSLMMEVEDETALSNIGLQYFGNLAVLGPGSKVVPYSAPDLQRTVMPVLGEMERLRNNRTAGYSSEAAFDGDQRKTKFQVSSELQQNAALSDTQLDFWNVPFNRLLQETVRRMARRTYVPMDPGGADIAKLRLRLTKRGVPLDALFNLDFGATKLVPAIGAGSASARTLKLEKMEVLRPRMDDVGRANLDRDLAIDTVGVERANRYFPRDQQARFTYDTSIAILQNGQLLGGIEVPVLPGDKHLAQAREHIKPLLEGFTAEQQGMVPIEEFADGNRLLFLHTVEHVDMLENDPASAEEAAQLRQALQQIGEVVSNGLRKIQAQEAKSQEEGGEEVDPQAAQNIADVELSREKLRQSQEMHSLKLQQLQEVAQVKTELAIESSRVKDAIADAREAAKIRRTPARPLKKNTP